jgi:hypothetical protein
MIDKSVDLKRMKIHTPEYYIWINNVIDCNITLDNAKKTIQYKCPHLKIADDELYRHRRLYILLNTLIKIRR